MEEKLKEIEKIIKKSRNYSIKHAETEHSVFELLEQIGINNPENIESDAPNADNLASAISTYIGYGEYSIKEIIKEIKNALN
jgi:hypothetical protein